MYIFVHTRAGLAHITLLFEQCGHLRTLRKYLNFVILMFNQLSGQRSICSSRSCLEPDACRSAWLACLVKARRYSASKGVISIVVS